MQTRPGVTSGCFSRDLVICYISASHLLVNKRRRLVFLSAFKIVP